MMGLDKMQLYPLNIQTNIFISNLKDSNLKLPLDNSHLK